MPEARRCPPPNTGSGSTIKFPTTRFSARKDPYYGRSCRNIQARTRTADKRCWARKFKHSSSAISAENLRHSHTLLLRSTPGTIVNTSTSVTCSLSITCWNRCTKAKALCCIRVRGDRILHNTQAGLAYCTWAFIAISKPTWAWACICGSLLVAFYATQSR